MRNIQDYNIWKLNYARSQNKVLFLPAISPQIWRAAETPERRIANQENDFYWEKGKDDKSYELG